MAVVVPLDSRQASITRLLLTETEPATVDAIASELKLTETFSKSCADVASVYGSPGTLSGAVRS